MQPIDLVTFVGFFVVVISLSLWKSLKKSGTEASESDYFLGGRSLTWPMIGISIVAANISSEQMVGMAGAAAAAQGLGVAAWQLASSFCMPIVAILVLPRFLRAGIYTIPEFLEYRYTASARTIMAVVTVVIYVGVLAVVLKTGGILLEVLAGIPLHQGIWIVAIIGTIYAAVGGLKALAWADLVQGICLLAGGLIIFYLGLQAMGGWDKFVAANPGKLKLLMGPEHPGHKDLPWHTVFTAMWIVQLYYIGLNQFIVQRNLAAKTLQDGQLGMLFAGFLWLLVPFAIVMPGMMAVNLYAADIVKPDQAFPTLVKQLVHTGLRGFICAAIAGAVVSTIAALLNSTSTLCAIDIYQKRLNPSAPDRQVVKVGRILTVVVAVTGAIVAPLLSDGIFTLIQQMQGYIWPGVVAAFLGAFLLPKTPRSAGVVVLALGPVLYAATQYLTRGGLFEKVPGSPAFSMHFLSQVLLVFGILFALMIAMSIVKPLPAPARLPVREGEDFRTTPLVKVLGAVLMLAVVAMFLIFR